MKNLILSCLIVGTLFITGCAVMFVNVRNNGDWDVYAGSVLKEIQLPEITITNSNSTITAKGYNSQNQAAQKLLDKALDKMP